jgi:hypothetical protein
MTLPEVGSVSGTVTRPDGSAFAFPDVYIEAPGGEWAPAVRDANGFFTFNGVPTGQALKVRAYWGSPFAFHQFYGETPFTLASEGETKTVDVRLPGFAKIALHRREATASRGGPAP